MANQVKIEDAKGNPDQILDLKNFLIDQLEVYVGEHQIQEINVFMAGHNFHRWIVEDLAKRWAKRGQREELTYRMADMTWRDAIRSMKKALPLRQ